MASPFNVRELRYRAGTTFNTAFTAPSTNATWDTANSVKLKVTSIDLSDLKYSAEADPALSSQYYSSPAPVPLLRTGAIKFTTMLEGAESDITNNPVATLLSKIMGGIQAPVTSRTVTVSSATAKVLTSSGIGAKVKPGQAVLVGTRGDGGGGAEVRVISADATNDINVAMNTAAVPVTNCNATLSTTVFIDPTATQSYIDTVVIGHSADDQVQTIGGMGTFTIDNLAPGKIPTVTFSINCADWQEVASANRASLATSVAASGNAPATDRGLGGFFLGDNGSQTRTVFKCAEFKCNPGIEYEAIPDLNGVNGIGGWIKKATTAPTFEATLILDGGAAVDPLPGMYNDFTAGTAKQLLVQFGHVGEKCVAIDFPKCYFDAAPVHTSAGGLAAVKVAGHGCMADHTAGTDNSLIYSAMRIHFF